MKTTRVRPPFRDLLPYLSPVVLLACIVLRASTLETTDLIDPTESRYAFVAQEMFQSGDWVTPKLPAEDGLQPYLGKPPLHFWLTTLCYSAFGVGEWTSRLPSFLFLLASVGFVCLFASGVWSSVRRGILAGLVLVSSPLLFVFSGASVVDVTLSGTLTAAFVAFARFFASSDPGKAAWWGRLVAVALALGFLTKGPVTLVLFALPVAGWLVVTGSLAHLLLFPFVSGAAVFLAVVSPWFYLVDARNPGFLTYYFWNENFARYLFREYGDRYGSGHVYPRGSAWWMLFVAFLPWSVPLCVLPLFRGTRHALSRRGERDRWTLYALFWGLSPAVFFTFVRQLHAGYLLPGIPGLALFTVCLMERLGETGFGNHALRYFRVLILAACGGAAVLVPVGLVLQAPLPFCLLSGVLVAGVMALFAAVRRRGELWELHATASLALVVLYSVFILQGSEYIGRTKSTGRLLYEISASGSSTPPEVAVVSRNSYSPFWHARAWEDGLAGEVRVFLVRPDALKERRPVHLIVKDGYERDIPPDVLSEYELVKRVGRWNWLRLTGHA